jgi:coniferyl-aldehyde dehydrogenase
MINDCLHTLRRSGVGASGMGTYHGEWGFRSFSKEKPVFYRPRLSATVLTQPPLMAGCSGRCGLRWLI